MGEHYTKKLWADLVKGGDPAPTMEFIESVLTGDDEQMISHEELLKRVTGYFRGITAEVVDDNGDIHTVWTQAPSKKHFALALGIPWETLCDYIRGYYRPGKPYSETKPDRQRLIATEDFPILRKSYALIEAFYEQKLSAGGNCTGSIFWLLNSKTGWTNDHTIEIQHTESPKQIVKLDDLPELPDSTVKVNDLDALPEYP